MCAHSVIAGLIHFEPFAKRDSTWGEVSTQSGSIPTMGFDPEQMASPLVIDEHQA
jgi:hypothetical protein